MKEASRLQISRSVYLEIMLTSNDTTDCDSGEAICAVLGRSVCAVCGRGVRIFIHSANLAVSALAPSNNSDRTAENSEQISTVKSCFHHKIDIYYILRLFPKPFIIMVRGFEPSQPCRVISKRVPDGWMDGCPNALALGGGR